MHKVDTNSKEENGVRIDGITGKNSTLFLHCQGTISIHLNL